jgi:ADP-ribose pyrophosphatase YjhB (NUDIX family)
MPIKNFSRNHAPIAFYKPDWNILFQDRTTISKDGEVFWFFGWGLGEWETFLEACVRETKEELDLVPWEDSLTEAVRFTKYIIWVWYSENVVFVSPWKDEYENKMKILEWDAWVWMTLEEAKNEIFFNHDYMVFDLLERYFAHHKIFV